MVMKKTKISVALPSKRVEALYSRVTKHIDQAHKRVQTSVDTEMVKAHWLIGMEIVEEEQQGKQRAEYGKGVLENLAIKLQSKYGRGFGIDTLEQARKFYLTYQLTSKLKSDAVRRKSVIPDLNPNLSWTHYRLLMRITRPEARTFYEFEASKNGWSSRELDR